MGGRQFATCGTGSLFSAYEFGISSATQTLRDTGHISIAVLPKLDGLDYPLPNEAMLSSLDTFFKERRTLTTRHHVVAPEYVPFTIRAVVKLHPDYLLERVEIAARTRFYNFLHPVYGGAEGSGWQFGRDVCVSEMIQILDGTEGVDYVRDLELIPNYRHDFERLLYDVTASRPHYGYALESDRITSMVGYFAE